MKHILRCILCHKYTMKPVCSCGGKAETTAPQRYQPDFKYKHLRRTAKKEELQKKGIL